MSKPPINPPPPPKNPPPTHPPNKPPRRGWFSRLLGNPANPYRKP